MNKRDLLQGFQVCRQEIESLRRENQLLGAENRAFNRLLSVLESHRPQERSSMCSEDILWKIRHTEESLNKEIEKEKIELLMSGKEKVKD